MPPNFSVPLVEWRGLWIGILAIVVLAVLVHSINKMPQDSKPGRQTKPHPAFCAWCVYRDGDMCGNPESPVNKAAMLNYHRGECGAVCSGEIKCTVRKMLEQ